MALCFFTMRISEIELDYLLDRRQPVDQKCVGIYFLFENDEVVYVGQALDMASRIRTHIVESKKSFSSHAQIAVPEEKHHLLNEIEAYFIHKFQPKYNITIPPQGRYSNISTFFSKSNFDKRRQVTTDLYRSLQKQKRFWKIEELNEIFMAAKIPQKTG